MKSILDPTFRYTPSHQTDIRKRFDEERKRLGLVQPSKPKNVIRIQQRKEPSHAGHGTEAVHPAPAVVSPAE
jgi:hypothetical protein